MSIFKTLGNKVKRFVSIKNVINAATGNFTALAADAKRVLTSPDPKKNKATDPASQVAYNTFEIPQPVNDMLAVQGAKQNARVVNALANTDAVQNLADTAVTTGIKALWLKHKAKVIGFGIALVSWLVIWKVFFHKKTVTKGRARR